MTASEKKITKKPQSQGFLAFILPHRVRICTLGKIANIISPGINLKTYGQSTGSYVWIVMANLIFELNFSDNSNSNPNVFEFNGHGAYPNKQSLS